MDMAGEHSFLGVWLAATCASEMDRVRTPSREPTLARNSAASPC
jgi:hypothetical protein